MKLDECAPRWEEEKMWQSFIASKADNYGALAKPLVVICVEGGRWRIFYKNGGLKNETMVRAFMFVIFCSNQN